MQRKHTLASRQVFSRRCHSALSSDNNRKGEEERERNVTVLEEVVKSLRAKNVIRESLR